MFNRKHPAHNREAVWNLLSGTVVQGVLVKQAGHQFILRAASVCEPRPGHGPEWAQADGEIVIDAANVDYVQVP